MIAVEEGQLKSNVFIVSRRALLDEDKENFCMTNKEGKWSL